MFGLVLGSLDSFIMRRVASVSHVCAAAWSVLPPLLELLLLLLLLGSASATVAGHRHKQQGEGQEAPMHSLLAQLGCGVYAWSLLSPTAAS